MELQAEKQNGVWEVTKAEFGVAVAGGVALAGEVANAAVDPSVSTGLTSLATDAATLAAMVTAAVVSIQLIKLGIRLLKSLMSKAV